MNPATSLMPAQDAPTCSGSSSDFSAEPGPHAGSRGPGGLVPSLVSSRVCGVHTPARRGHAGEHRDALKKQDAASSFVSRGEWLVAKKCDYRVVY